MLLNMLIPLVLHVGGGMKNIPKLRNQININVFSYFQSIIVKGYSLKSTEMFKKVGS